MTVLLLLLLPLLLLLAGEARFRVTRLFRWWKNEERGIRYRIERIVTWR